MSYVLGISEEEYREADLQLRRDGLALEAKRVAAERQDRIWQAVTAIATGVLPIAAFFGVRGAVRNKK